MRTFFYAVVMGCSIASGAPLASPLLAEERKPSADQATIAAAAKVVQATIDASRANDFERWISHFAPNAYFEINGTPLRGRKEVRRSFRANEATGVVDEIGLLKDLRVLESGWTGERVYVWQQETYSGGYELVTYAEYEVKGGKVVAMYANF